jgi:hypothetical protein
MLFRYLFFFGGKLLLLCHGCPTIVLSQSQHTYVTVSLAPCPTWELLHSFSIPSANQGLVLGNMYQITASPSAVHSGDGPHLLKG